MPHHEIVIALGGTRAENTRTIHLGDTFRIHYPGMGFTFKYTNGFPFGTTDSQVLHRPSGEEREATRIGSFPFDCFMNGNAIVPTPGGPAVAGEIIVDPEG